MTVREMIDNPNVVFEVDSVQPMRNQGDGNSHFMVKLVPMIKGHGRIYEKVGGEELNVIIAFDPKGGMCQADFYHGNSGSQIHEDYRISEGSFDAEVKAIIDSIVFTKEIAEKVCVQA